ncbi:HPP family protein [Aliikangiella sp. IMCC44359]|uniref:HPP family protein n=1 Tax=Aliikangiella sp. IMCC44359 TaxID=3459125 RepID=UPI00403A7D95
MAMRTMSDKEIYFSIVGAFIATLFASFFSHKILEVEGIPMILASTGASAMLIFGIPHSPVSKPWPIVGGHLVSAVVGITAYYCIPESILASSIAIAISMLAMHYLACMHPPGGATAVTAVIGGTNVHELGYYFVIVPVLFNSIILLSVAMAVATFRDKNPFLSE